MKKLTPEELERISQMTVHDAGANLIIIKKLLAHIAALEEIEANLRESCQIHCEMLADLRARLAKAEKVVEAGRGVPGTELCLGASLDNNECIRCEGDCPIATFRDALAGMEE